MSLLTPPNTSHRHKENVREVEFNTNSRVAWAEINKIHILQLSTTTDVTTCASASKRPPLKSILKRVNTGLLSPWPTEKQRDITPEPSDPLVDLDYLDYPVSTIVEATDATKLKPLIEAYCILSARLRASVTGETDADASWPLFQPLRKNQDAFTKAVVRDLGRALVDPAAVGEKTDDCPLRVLLPSPRNTPNKKKRDGMSAEEVKFARDLCTISHAAIRCLSLVFTLPAVMNIFTVAQLSQMLTGVLAIPLAENLPTPNARKTWALAIWLIQIQRLPPQVLAPAADRIAMAVYRGIEGELGREGKKGSASDGLKAIHDLSIHLPDVFIPAFTHSALPSVLATLLAPNLTLRTAAAHALGGFTAGATMLPSTELHARIAELVSHFITTPHIQSTATSPSQLNPESPKKQKEISSPPPPEQLKVTLPLTPTKSQDPSIIRTLRATLQATEPIQPAHGPVWGICVLSAFIALLGPTMMKSEHTQIRLLMQLGLRHKNRTVRALTAIMWRVVIWVGLQPPFPAPTDSDGDTEAEEEGRERIKEEKSRRAREEWWRLATSVVEFETGVCAIAAYTGSTNPGVPFYETPRYKYIKISTKDETEKPLRRSLEMLYTMVCKDAPTRASAVDVLRQLVSATFPSRPDQDEDHVKRTLLPKSLFCALPGLLSAEYTALKSVVNPIFEETPKAEDVRPLTHEEMQKHWVWNGIVKAWKAAASKIGDGEAEKEREDLVHIWEGLVSMGMATEPNAESENINSEGGNDQDAAMNFIGRAINVVVTDVLEDFNLHLNDTKGDFGTGNFTSLSPSSSYARLSFARDLWGVLYRLVPSGRLIPAAERLATCLVHNAEEYTTFTGHSDADSVAKDSEGEELNGAWVEFCVSVLATIGPEAVGSFWGQAQDETVSQAGGRIGVCRWTAAERAAVWRVFVKAWMEQGSGAGWEGGVAILVVPFVRFEHHKEQMWETTEDDAQAWQELMNHTASVALDYGHDSITVLDTLGNIISDNIYMLEDIRLVELLLTHMNTMAVADELREFSEPILEFIATTMVASYPPPQDQTKYTWVIRALTTLVDHCPRSLMDTLGKQLAEAVAIWICDAECQWDTSVIEYDVLPLYQTFLAAIQGFPTSPSLFGTYGTILSGPLTAEVRDEIRQPAIEAFREFWETSYSNVEVSKRGWGEEIEICLGAVYGAVENSLSVISEDSTEAPQGAELETLLDRCPSTPIQFAEIVIPSTPITVSSLSDSATLFPGSPTKLRRFPHSPHSPMRAASAHLGLLSSTCRTSPQSPVAKRRKLTSGNKENISPAFERPSFFDRIAHGSKALSRVSLGKRPLESDSEEDRLAVEDLVALEEPDVFVTPMGSSKTLPSGEAHPSLKMRTSAKRKRMFMEAVEVPSIDEIYPRYLKLRTNSVGITAPSSAHKKMRRTKSETSINSHVETSNPSSSSARKQRRKGLARMRKHSKDGVIAIEPEAFVSTALYSPLSSQIPEVPSSELSSDDDPHIGQVTPHHLISPELKRGRGRDPDPVDFPSDDSIMAPSPSRDMLKRRLQRLGSDSCIEKVKLFAVSS